MKRFRDAMNVFFGAPTALETTLHNQCEQLIAFTERQTAALDDLAERLKTLEAQLKEAVEVNGALAMLAVKQREVAETAVNALVECAPFNKAAEEAIIELASLGFTHH